MKLLVAQLCPTLCDLMDYSPSVSSVYGIFQTRILEWAAIPISRDLPDTGIEARSPVLQADSFCLNHQGSPKVQQVISIYKDFLLLSLHLDFLTLCFI